jgi:hypothetical protein
MHQIIVKKWMQKGRKKTRSVEGKSLYLKIELSKIQRNHRNQIEIND